ncbi:MAG TPA: ABC transporter ATP-binding protein, partial [Rhodospirillaceae bacterium]|nr:ABC transporter ATP-binding protein [Rhodospirillaceae bacterium]
SHLLADIEEICDRIAVIHDGRMVFIGTADELIKRHQAVNLERAFLTAIETA